MSVFLNVLNEIFW